MLDGLGALRKASISFPLFSSLPPSRHSFFVFLHRLPSCQHKIDVFTITQRCSLVSTIPKAHWHPCFYRFSRPSLNTTKNLTSQRKNFHFYFSASVVASIHNVNESRIDRTFQKLAPIVAWELLVKSHFSLRLRLFSSIMFMQMRRGLERLVDQINNYLISLPWRKTYVHGAYRRNGTTKRSTNRNIV